MSLMRERITPAVPFTLTLENEDGSVDSYSFRLAFDTNAFVAFQDVTGINILQNMDKVFDDPDIAVVTALFWVALHKNHPEYATREGLRLVRCNVNISNVKAVLNACSDAFIAQLGKEAQERVKKIRAGEKGEPKVPLESAPDGTQS